MLYYMFHIMAVNVSAISHSSYKFLHKKNKTKTNQGSSNAQRKYILKHRHARRKIIYA